MSSEAATRIALALGTFIGVASIALAVRHLAFRAVKRWGTRTTSAMATVVIASLRWPTVAWAVLLGAYIAVDLADLPPRPSATILKILFALLVISMTAAAANLSGAALRQGLRQTSLAIPATGLSFAFVNVVIWVTGGLILLGGLGISIAPVLTALGVGGLAVALALQDTLSNFFAGIHLLIERPVRVGDFIKLETGQEGYVEDIGWRTTRIRMLPNNMVIMPNSKLTQSIVTNYYLPEPRMSLVLPVSVSYAADPDVIERLLVEEAKALIGRIPGLLAEPEPFVRFIPGFGESSMDFSLICQVREFTDQYLAQHELRKRILQRFRQEGIDIPYPQRTVHVSDGAPPLSERPVQPEPLPPPRS
jgi:small-conductance mechanosensitive channel